MCKALLLLKNKIRRKNKMTNDKQTIISFRLLETGDVNLFKGLDVIQTETGYEINCISTDHLNLEKSERVIIYGLDTILGKIIFKEYGTNNPNYLPKCLRKNESIAYIGKRLDTEIIKKVEKEQDLRTEIKKETYNILKKIEEEERKKRIQTKKNLEHSLKFEEADPLVKEACRKQIEKVTKNILYLEMIKKYPEIIL